MPKVRTAGTFLSNAVDLFSHASPSPVGKVCPVGTNAAAGNKMARIIKNMIETLHKIQKREVYFSMIKDQQLLKLALGVLAASLLLLGGYEISELTKTNLNEAKDVIFYRKTDPVHFNRETDLQFLRLPEQMF